MKKVLFHVIVMMMVFLYGNLFSQDNSNVKRLKRSESFLGIHFDFHAGNDCKEIGKNVDREMIEYIIDKVHPDYVQCDSKGHPGQSSYLTKVGNRAPGFVGNPLKIWREVTAERGVALYVHHSGVWDDKSCEVHPEWACINEKGEKSKRKISVFGPYVDELLIPQIKELAVDYGVDGVWIDGECWAVERDYSEKALLAFHEKTGITSVPRSPDDPYWFEFNQFCRDGFRDYVRHYVTELHKSVPNLQIASNWAFTSLMPEPVSIDVDFISGDYSAQNSFNSARFEGRVMVHQGKPWDLMAWSFTWRDGLYSTKPLRQLEQEASVVLALGGGFQAYFPQKRDGSIRKWQMNLMGDVAKFCRDRQEFCFKSKPVPQVGLILSTNAFYRINKGLFAGGNELPISIKGVLQCLLDGQNVTDVVMEHHLQERADDFPLLIYPEWDYIDPDFKNVLLEYVKKGGKLLVIGPAAAKLFEKELGVTLKGEAEKKVNGLAYNNWIAAVNSESIDVDLGDTARPFGEIHYDNDFQKDPSVAASVTNYGKGEIAAIYFNIGHNYLNASTTVCRDFLSAVVKELFPNPVVTVEGSHNVDVTLNRIKNKLTINLINSSGPHADKQVNTFDQIPTVGPLEVTVLSNKKPDAVTLQPGGQSLNFTFKQNEISFVVPKLEIHEIVVIE